MKIRTALVLACFLLSVVPLAGIVTYSYFSSRRALESAYHAEAARLTGRLERLGSRIAAAAAPGATGTFPEGA